MKIESFIRNLKAKWYDAYAWQRSKSNIWMQFTINIHYYHILHIFMNTIIGRESFNKLPIPLDSRCSSTIVMGRIVEKLCLEKDYVMQWHTQAGNITTNFKVKVYFTLPTRSAMNVMTWKCPVDDSAKVRYDIISGWYLLTQSWLNLKISEHGIESDDGTFKGYTTCMVDLGIYIFKDFNTGKIKPREWFTNSYLKEVY